MGKYAQLIMGPAGSGKSTYCHTLFTHCENSKRSVHCINLDPAAEEFKYPVSIDIREMITVDDVMEDLQLGPNGGLIYAMEFLNDNIEIFQEQLGDFEDDYLLIDCPGQIELYSHLDVMSGFVKTLQNMGYYVCGIYLIDSTFIDEPSKFLSGVLMCLSAMIRLEVPHINVLSKMDLLGKMGQDEEFIDKYINPDFPALIHDLNKNTSQKFHKLNAAIAKMIDDHSLVSFVPLDPTDESSIEGLLLQVDSAIQYGEDNDVRVRDFDAETNEEIDEDNFE